MAKIKKSEFNYSTEWRKSLKFKDYSYEGFIKFLTENKNREYIMSEKLDGELNALIYNEGNAPYFITKSRVIHDRPYPLLAEYKNLFDSNKYIKSIVVVGELKAYSKNQPLIPLNKSQSIIRTGNVDLVNHYPFAVLEMNGQKVTDYEDFEDIRSLIGYQAHIRHPRYVLGNVEKFKEFWNQIVTIEHGEGLVIQDDFDPKLKYRVKQVLTADAVVVAAGDIQGLAWAKKQIGYFRLALLNARGDFLMTSKVGTGAGFTKKSKEALYTYVNNHAIDRDTQDLWLPPIKIAEVTYRRHRFSEVDVIRYENNKYRLVGREKGVMMDQVSFQRFRDDKQVTYADLSINQFPCYKGIDIS